MTNGKRAALAAIGVVVAVGLGIGAYLFGRHLNTPGAPSAASYARQSCKAFHVDSTKPGIGLLDNPAKTLTDVRNGADLAASAAKRDARWQSLSDADTTMIELVTAYQAEAARLSVAYPGASQTPQMSDLWNTGLQGAVTANEAACRIATAK